MLDLQNGFWWRGSGLSALAQDSEEILRHFRIFLEVNEFLKRILENNFVSTILPDFSNKNINES